MLDRRLIVAGVLMPALLLAGCMTAPRRPANADGTYCYRIGKVPRRTVTCTPQVVPSAEVEAEVKRFEVDPAALTVYLVRKRWADTRFVVPIAVDDRQVGAGTIPVSLIRFRLRPGAHRLSFEWGDRVFDTVVEGSTGDVRFVELVGASWAWGTTFEWATVDAESSKRRGNAARLVADVDLRAS